MENENGKCDIIDVWILTERDDLLDDCISYVEDNYAYSYEIKDLVIEYLSLKCADAMSTADLKAMADEDNIKSNILSELLTYEEADQGV